jgi:ribose 1,5-bisphosphokinase
LWRQARLVIDEIPPPAFATGLLVLVVGASGVGKDALLASARSSLGGDASFVFARRTITRAADATEDHVAVSAAEFSTLESQGSFAFSWAAHGLRYGLPSGIEAAISTGRTVVCNVSRTVIADARRRFRRVRVIEITADKAVRADRLARRGRESTEAIVARLSHAPETESPTRSDVLIKNNGRLEEAAVQFIAVLRS